MEYNKSKTYIAIVRSDGDNLQIVTNGEKDHMEKRLALCSTSSKPSASASTACPPMTWTLSNRLLDFAPSVLRWYFAAVNRTGNDAFLMGPSGYGTILCCDGKSIPH
jgi:hypothetical protein